MKACSYLLCLFCLISGCTSQEEQHAVYQAWRKAHSVTNLSFEEWKLLANRNLLPGQTQQNTDSDVISAAALGIAIGNAANMPSSTSTYRSK